ncbi:MAG TPA: NAD(P)-dependent alcohol dehydrogenase [Acidimicrobiia bacterium]|nr:NAD(P)-dependent alcohol dehydrogenase [Acidimicrobiia bacterium]
MRAITYTKYGPPDVLTLSNVDKPVPGDHDVLIRVVAASVNRSDWETLVGKPFYARIGGWLRPKTPTPGTDVAGVVEAVGALVTAFAPGDEVFGDIMYHGGKAFADYVCVKDTAVLVPKPESLSFEEASTLPQAGLIALQGTRERIAPGDRVLINGAGGGAGILAIQMAKTAGAEVTGVDNAHKQAFMRSMGADRVIDYTAEDYTRSGKYDLILDFVCERSMFAIRRALAPGGRYSIVGGRTRALLSAVTLGRLLSTGGRRMGVLMVRPNTDDLATIGDRVARGELRTHIDRVFPLEETAAALRYLGDGLVLGKVVITTG